MYGAGGAGIGRTTMSSQLKLAGICFAAALGLAACGGGGGGTATPPPQRPNADSLKADAADAITAAVAAGVAAEQAKKDAIKYSGMLTAEAVSGESAMAVANAQKVLDAEMAANDAVTAADDALNDAMETKTAAEVIPEDVPGRAGAIAAAEEAIKQATAQKRAAMDIVDEAEDDAAGIQSLKGAVAAVKGSNPLAEDYPTMPAAFGKTVASQVMTAIDTAVPATNGTISDTTPMGGIKNDAADIGAMTWAMIVGEDNIMMERIGDANAALPVASIAGMAASAVDKTTTPVLSATGGTNGDGKYPDGAAQGTASVTGTPGTEYKGIPGAVWCLGGTDGCSVNADGTLSSGWYFTPTSATALYIASSTTADSYVAATMYATYGYWLTYDGAGAATGIALHAASTANQGNLDLGQAGQGNDATDVTATYSGSAVGISVRGDASGQFTADVNLTAKFAVNPTLRGSISNFQGKAVGNWTVLLNENALGTGSFIDGITAGGGSPGVWTAQAYGPPPADHDGDANTDLVDQRPTGFFGRFSADFSDGAAAGAYTARAD